MFSSLHNVLTIQVIIVPTTVTMYATAVHVNEAIKTIILN